MKRNNRPLALLWCALLAVLFLGAAVTSASGQAPRILPGPAKDLLGKPNVVFVDVRSAGDWAGSGAKIAGAVRRDPGRLMEWQDRHSTDQFLIFYCA